jgi:hypothetical protein
MDSRNDGLRAGVAAQGVFMHIFSKVLTPLVALFALAGCGGSVSGVGDHDAGPGDDANDTPPNDGGPVNPNCPTKSQVSDGYSCSLSGLVCPSSQTVADCQGNAKSLACFCDGESWTCEQATPVNCPVQLCPSPQSIYAGGSCLSAGIGNQCPATNVTYPGCYGQIGVATNATCTCTSSGWSCPVPLPQCPVQACPDPYSVSSYQSCSSSGMVCPGNPQNCDGDTYYDALQCEGYWVPVATTSCNIGGYDAGNPYAGPDGAVGYPGTYDAGGYL